MSSLEKLGILPELKSFALFKGFSNEQIISLCANAEIRVTQHREHLFHAQEKADGFYIVISGAYKLTKPTPTGEDSILHFAHNGDVIGAFIMSQPNPIYPISAISMGPSRALRIARTNYLESWKNNGDLIFHIQNLLSTRMASMQNQRVLAKSPLHTKIASLLVELLDTQAPSASSVTLLIPLTRKEIADTVGASVESIIRIMSDWSKKGYISTEGHHITILRTDKIVELMTSES